MYLIPHLCIRYALTPKKQTGLIDGDEAAETAAMRELEEETGFKASGVLDSTPLLWSDPGELCDLTTFFHPCLHVFSRFSTTWIDFLFSSPNHRLGGKFHSGRHDYGDDEDGHPGRTRVLHT